MFFCACVFLCAMSYSVCVVLLSAWACVCECICMGPLKVIDECCRRCICLGCVNINLWGSPCSSRHPSILLSLHNMAAVRLRPINLHTYTQLSLHWHCHFSTLISWWVQWSFPRFVKTHIFTHISTNTQVTERVTLTHLDTHINMPPVVYCNLSVWANMYQYVHIWALVK